MSLLYATTAATTIIIIITKNNLDSVSVWWSLTVSADTAELLAVIVSSYSSTHIFSIYVPQVGCDWPVCCS